MAKRTTSQLDIGVLGPVRAAAGESELDLGGVKPRLVLALLVANAGAVVATDQLVDALWGDDPVPTARKTLQVHVSNLRRSLGEDAPIVTERSGYRLDPAGVTIDAVEFERDCRRAASLPDGEASSVLSAALARWRGLAYADLRHEDAIRAEAVRLDELRVGAIEQRIDADLRLGRHERLLGELEALTTEHPFRERLRCLQLVALYRSGRQAEALRAYERARHTLADELGLEPGPELRRLQQAVLEHAPELHLPDLDLPGLDRRAARRTDASLPTEATSVRGYELRELIARGAVASVHRAYQPSVGREVAIEIIPPDVANEPAFVRRFEADCRLLADLDHPHVVSLYDYWRDPSGAYLVMPLMRGGSLDRALSAGPLEPSAALRVVEQVGAALAHAHRRGVVHGDVRPSDVLLDEEGNAYLSEFVPDGHPDTDRAGSEGGVDYTSPERRAGGPVTRATDVWSFGVLACHVLTGADVDDGAFTRAGLPSGLLADLRRATDPDPDRRFDDVEDVVRACRRAFGVAATTGAGIGSERRARNPYKGLRAFGESDAGDFFGRDDLVDELVKRVNDANLTVVVGPSGCGKSSLVKAGLIPALRRDGVAGGHPVVVAEMLPGTYPFEELESALLHVAVDRPAGLLDTLRSDDLGLVSVAEQILPDEATVLVLVVDQFEELFTSTREEAERQRFLASLRSAAVDGRSRVRVVVTLRADFFDRPLRHAEFADLVRASTMAVAMPGETGLAAAIAEPARRVGLQLEADLLPTILRDVADEPGALPLLQYALTELVAERDHDELTIETYRRTGGVVGALARRAEAIFEDLAPHEQDAAREMFVRLVSVNDDSDDTRRRVRLTELRGLDVDPAGLERALDAFGTFRLLTFDRDAATRTPTVEIAHEALIREWPRLRTWIDDRRDDLRTERRLRTEAAEWQAAQRDPSYLIGGVRLRRYEEWAASSDVRLSADERSFVAAARTLQDERNRSAARRRGLVLTAVSILAVAAVVAAVIAVIQGDRAGERADEANRAAAAAEQLRSAAERAALEDSVRALVLRLDDLPDPDLRLLLALDGHDALAAAGADVETVAGALYQFTIDHNARARFTLARLDAEDRLPLSGSYVPTSLVSSADGSLLVATPVGGSTATAFDGITGERVGSIRPGGGVLVSTWDRSRDLVLTGTDDARIISWQPNGDVVDTFETPGRLVAPIGRSGNTLAYADFGRGGPATSLSGGPPFSVVLADPVSGDELLRTTRTMVLATSAPDGDRLVTVDVSDRLHMIDLRTVEHHTSADWPAAANADWSPDGRTLWLLDDQRLLPFHIESGVVGDAIPTGLTNTSYLDISPSGLMAAVGGAGVPTRILALPDGDVIADLQSSVGPATGWEQASQQLEPIGRMSVTWLSDRRLAVEHGDPVIWDLDELRAPTTVWADVPFAPAVSARARPDSEMLDTHVMGSERGDVVVRRPDGTTLRLAGSGADRDVPAPPVVAADGSTMVVPGAQMVEVRDTATGDVLARGPVGFPRPLALTPDGERMLVASGRDPVDGQYRFALADTSTGELVRIVAWLAHAESAAVGPDGRVALVAVSVRRAGGTNQPTLLWLVDMRTGTVIRRGALQECTVDVAIDGSGDRAVAIGCDGTLGLYDVTVLAEKGPPQAAVLDRAKDEGATGTGVAISPDGGTVVVTRANGRVDGFRVEDDVLVPVWSFDVGDHVGAPIIEGDTLWLGVTRPIDLPGDVGGMIGVPLDLEELVAFARTLPTRALTDDECATYAVGGTCSTG